jgi:hypothetical protein
LRVMRMRIWRGFIGKKEEGKMRGEIGWRDLRRKVN